MHGFYGDGGYGTPSNTGAPAGPSPGSAMPVMPKLQDLGGAGPAPPWIRAPYYPTAPYQSTRPDVGYLTRFYRARLLSTETDYTVGTEAIRTVQFDIPGMLIAVNGSAFSTATGNALPVGVTPRGCWYFRAEYTQGDRLIIDATLAENVVGTMERPGQIGGFGWMINSGANFVLGITPLIAALTIDVTLVVQEVRGPTNYTR